MKMDLKVSLYIKYINWISNLTVYKSPVAFVEKRNKS